MLSRRSLLQAGSATVLMALKEKGATAPSVVSREAVPPTRDYWNDWPAYMKAVVADAREKRKALLAAVRTEAQAFNRIKVIRNKIWELIGGEFERTPLNPVVVGSLDRTGYRIEKIIFEGQPQFHVTAHLYIPTHKKGPFPAILAPLGHAQNGKTYRTYQCLFQNLARKGFMVLTFDPFGQGERQQYLDEVTGKSKYGPTGEHDKAGWPMLLLGTSCALYEAWDGIRALDYLLSRPETDPDRVGCTGRSGGGTQTMYLCALEPRIRVAVEVEGNSENFAGRTFEAPGAYADAEQNLIGSLPVGIDRGDLLYAFAPRPLLICYTPQDAGSTYSATHAEGTLEIYDELRGVYRAFKATEKVDLYASPLPHDYDAFTRRAAYEWFNRWLGDPNAGAAEEPFEDASEAELNCTSTGQVLTSLGGRSVVQVNADWLRTMDITAGSAPAKEKVRASLQRLLALPSERTPLDARLLATANRGDMVMEEIEFCPEPRIRIPGWLLRPVGAGPFATVVYLFESGKDSILEEGGDFECLVGRGCVVCSFDMRGIGILTPRFPSGGPFFYGGDPFVAAYAWASLTMGKPILGQRVWDFLRCLDYLETRPEVDRSRIYVAGSGEAGLVALVGTVLDDRPQSLLAEMTLADFHSVVTNREYKVSPSSFVFGFLKELDLPIAVASIAPRCCWMFNSRSANGNPLPESELRARYRVAIDAYEKAGARGRLSFIVQPQERRETLLAWVANV